MKRVKFFWPMPAGACPQRLSLSVGIGTKKSDWPHLRPALGLRTQKSMACGTILLLTKCTPC